MRVHSAWMHCGLLWLTGCGLMTEDECGSGGSTTWEASCPAGSCRPTCLRKHTHACTDTYAHQNGVRFQEFPLALIIVSWQKQLNEFEQIPGVWRCVNETGRALLQPNIRPSLWEPTEWIPRRSPSCFRLINRECFSTVQPGTRLLWTLFGTQLPTGNVSRNTRGLTWETERERRKGKREWDRGNNNPKESSSPPRAVLPQLLSPSQRSHSGLLPRNSPTLALSFSLSLFPSQISTSLSLGPEPLNPLSDSPGRLSHRYRIWKVYVKKDMYSRAPAVCLAPRCCHSCVQYVDTETHTCALTSPAAAQQNAPGGIFCFVYPPEGGRRSGSAAV